MPVVYDLGSGNADYGAHPVGTKAANGKGLYDMSGNVWEWCWDWYDTITSGTLVTGAASGSSRLVRGGGWSGDASDCTVAIRYSYGPTFRYELLGFRFVCP